MDSVYKIGNFVAVSTCILAKILEITLYAHILYLQ